MSKTKQSVLYKEFGNFVAITPRYFNDITNREEVDCRCMLCNKIHIGVRYGTLASKFKKCSCQRKYRYDFKTNDDKRAAYLLVRVFHAMRYRCYNPSMIQFNNYGGKGITIQQSWLDDPNKFIEWALQNGYQPDKGLEIDRIDPSKSYTEDNVRFVPRSINLANRGKYKCNKFRYIGIVKTSSGKYKGNITVRGKNYRFPSRNTQEQAVIDRNNFIIANNLQEIGYRIQPIQGETK